MKLLQNLLIAFLFLAFMACGGGEGTETGSETDTDTTETNDETETTPDTEEEEDGSASAEITEEDMVFAKAWKLTTFTHEDGKVEEVDREEDMVLKEDGTFSLLLNTKEIASGKWSVKKDGETKTLILAHETGDMAIEGKSEEMEIVEVSDTELSTKDDGGLMTEIWKAVELESAE